MSMVDAIFKISTVTRFIYADVIVKQENENDGEKIETTSEKDG